MLSSLYHGPMPSRFDRSPTTMCHHPVPQSNAHRPLHPGPEVKGRILPPIYTLLRSSWLRASGERTLPIFMHEEHRKNAIRLLKESHGNLVGKTTWMLGAMARHFRNQPEIVDGLIDLCLKMQQIEVDELYPIFTALVEADSRDYEREDLSSYDFYGDM